MDVWLLFELSGFLFYFLVYRQMHLLAWAIFILKWCKSVLKIKPFVPCDQNAGCNMILFVSWRRYLTKRPALLFLLSGFTSDFFTWVNTDSFAHSSEKNSLGFSSSLACFSECFSSFPACRFRWTDVLVGLQMYHTFSIFRWWTEQWSMRDVQCFRSTTLSLTCVVCCLVFLMLMFTNVL